MNKLSEQSYWDKHWVDETKTANEEYLFNSFLRQYLPSQGTYFEIGCAPSSTLGLGNIPNRWFSPYIILVAKRDKGTKE